MCGDAKSCCESDFDVREMGSAIDASCGIVIMSGYKEVYLCGRVSRELVAIMRNVVGLCVVCDVVAGGSVERVLKGMN